MLSFSTSTASMRNSIFFEMMFALTMVRRSCITSVRWTSFSSIFTRPLSMRLMSRTSLMRLSRCWPEVEILER